MKRVQFGLTFCIAATNCLSHRSCPMVSSLSDRKSLQTLQVSDSDRLFFDICEKANISDDCFIGLPSPTFNQTEFSNGFVFWFPDAIPNGNSISVTSSRLSQKLDSYTDWFDALRTLAVRTSKATNFLLSMTGTTTDPFLKRISELFEIPLLTFEEIPEIANRSWFDSQLARTDESNNQLPAFYKPLAKTKHKGRDFLLNQIASQTYALSIRNGGNVYKSVERRIADATDSTTRILVNDKLTTAKTRNALLDLGGTAWWLFNANRDESNGDSSVMEAEAIAPTKDTNTTMLSLDEIKTSDFLLHWTRRRVGAWPDQTQNEFYDDLIFKADRRNHNEFASLCRILASRRILGSHHLTRDARDVVCFSDVPISEVPDRRVFRPHLSRWDFEPYGIAIDRNFLESLGAQPVIYGFDQDWEQLSKEKRPYFQLENTKSETIDWQQEHEWRILGDLNLESIPHDHAIVFVNSYDEAQTVGELCHWPVVVLSN